MKYWSYVGQILFIRTFESSIMCCFLSLKYTMYTIHTYLLYRFSMRFASSVKTKWIQSQSVAHKVSAVRSFPKWKWNTGCSNYARHSKRGMGCGKNQNKGKQQRHQWMRIEMVIFCVHSVIHSFFRSFVCSFVRLPVW